jgi:hypothetical protein
VAALWVEQRRGWGWFLFVGSLLLALVYLFAASIGGASAFTTEAQEVFYVIALFMSAPVFAGRYFLAMGRTEAALLVLMRPASTFEKWLLALLVVAIGYPLAFSVAFELVNVPAWLMARASAAEQFATAAAAGDQAMAMTRFAPENFRLFVPWDIGPDDAHVIPAIFLWMLGMQGFAVLGSLHFHGMALLKTILAAFVLMIVLSMLSALTGGTPETVLTLWNVDAELSRGNTVVALLFWFGVPGLLWLAAYFALQEREIHR